MKKSGMRYGCCLNSNYKTKLLKNHESLLNFGINLGINIIFYNISISCECERHVHDCSQGRRQEEGTTHPPLSLSPSIPLRHSLSLSLHCARLEHQQWCQQSFCLSKIKKDAWLVTPVCSKHSFVCFYLFSITTTVLPLNPKELYAVC